ncbi:hypothetical protein LTR66_006665 [Elasticomyces elasticus]|nr:hypothetical protein LTR66_006665 [Elasticomyces elasticus]
MALGSITHMQYYFARTGLLDGKGAQLTNGERKRSIHGATEATIRKASDPALTSPTFDGVSAYPFSDVSFSPDDGKSPVESPTDQLPEDSWDTPASVMLPPTPLPDLVVLRRELRETLEDAAKVLDEVKTGQGPCTSTDDTKLPLDCPDHKPENQGWYEIQGLHLLDITTLAIRAAKNYYTAHDNPQKLYAVRSERQIRSDLHQVLDVLKRMAMNNFAGGVRQTERESILQWIGSVHSLLSSEEEAEQSAEEERVQWTWLHGDWTNRERERELLFLRCFDSSGGEPLPRWTTPDNSTPTSFLLALQDGSQLVHLHNSFVEKSKRKFGEIKTFHTDTSKPYRCAENLRYWLKAAELRWDIRLSVDVSAVVNGKAGGWKGFDEAILKWSQIVRGELMSEWAEHKEIARRQLPPLDIDAGSVVDMDVPF